MLKRFSRSAWPLNSKGIAASTNIRQHAAAAPLTLTQTRYCADVEDPESVEPRSSGKRSFRPFSRKDEDDLVKSLTTKPRHVLRKVRQLVWRSRKSELQFRNTVTFLMITVQDNLRKQVMDPHAASLIMEGVMEECVRMAQHDMAHLLFRAFLRFRKYGCKITLDCLRHLFDSYKGTNNSDLMHQLSVEMSGEQDLRALCIAALLYANRPQEAEELRKKVPMSELTTSDVVALVDGYEKLKDWGRLESILNDIPSLPEPQINKGVLLKSFLRVYQRKGDAEKLEAVLHMVSGLKIGLDPAAFATILRYRINKAQNVEDVQKAEEELKAMGYEFDIQGNSILISAFARMMNFGDRNSEEIMLAKVDTLLSSIEARLKQGDPDLDVSVSHLRAVIRGYGAAGKQDLMRKAWDRMQFKGLSNDARVYNEMIKWYSLMGSVKDVLELKDHMHRNEVYPDAITYTWILRSLGKFYPRQVERMAQELELNKVRPDLPLYTTMLGVFGDLANFDKVEKIYEEIRRREDAGTLQPSPFTFAVLMRVYSKNLAKVEELYDSAKHKGVHDHPHVVTILLHSMAKNNALEKMEALLKTWPTWSTNVYNVLLHLYGKKNDKDKVIELLEKMKTEQVEFNDVTYGTLVTVFGRWKETQRVLEVLEMMKKSENPQISANFYAILATTMSKLGDNEGVNDAWEDLLASRLYPDTEVYNVFLTLYGKQHNMTKMQTVLDNMLKHVPPNPLTSSTVIDMLGKAGKISDMETLLSEMKNHPDMNPTAVTYHQVMNAYAKTGDIVKMERARQDMLAKGHAENAVTYNILADGYGRAKRYEQLTEVVEMRRAKEIPLDEMGFCVLVTAYARARMTSEVNKVVAMFESTPTVTISDKLVWTLIDAYCRCGETVKMEQWVKRLHGGQPLKVADKSSLIAYYGRVGAIEKMEEMATEIRKEKADISFVALNSMAKTYARVGKFDKTVEILHQLRDRKQVPDASTSLMLSGLFIKAGLHEQAQQIVQWRKQYAQSYTDEPET